MNFGGPASRLQAHEIPFWSCLTWRKAATLTRPAGKQRMNETRLCGCGRCATVSFRLVWGTQEVKVLPRFSHLANLSSRSWFDAVLFSTEGVYAAPVCPKWSDQGLSFISVGAGTYGLHLSFSHASCEEAFAPRAPQPRPAERCLLLDSDGHAARLSVPRCGNNRCLIPVDSARWIVDAATQDESAFEIDGVRVRFHEPLRHQSLVGIPQHCKCIFLGDSHTERLSQSLRRTLHRSTHDCTFRFDGDGIYHNLSPDKNLSKFIQGKMPNEFVQGHMLSSLAPGSAYDQLQKKENISLWAFQSGHWDLRDVSLETYLEHVAKLFKAFRIRCLPEALQSPCNACQLTLAWCASVLVQP